MQRHPVEVNGPSQARAHARRYPSLQTIHIQQGWEQRQ
jgi:hypothetical protein